MNLRLLPLFLAAGVLGTGCMYEGYTGKVGPGSGLSDLPGSGANASITFDWTFNGASCTAAGVSTVVVSIPGQQLQYDGRYACTNGAQDGITLDDFAPGIYDYSISAYDANGRLAFQGSGEVTINGSSLVEVVDCAPSTGGVPYHSDAGTGGNGGYDAGNGSNGGYDGGTNGTGGFGGYDAGTGGNGGYDAGSGSTGGYDAGGGGYHTCGCGGGMDAGSYHAYLSWVFPQVPAAPTCGDELTQLVLTIDGQPVIHECGAGLFPSRVSLPGITPGQHTVEIDAKDATGLVWATTQSTINVASTGDTYQTYQVPWIVGSAAVDYTFFDCNDVQLAPGCAAAGVDTMAVNFLETSGSWLYADTHNLPADLRLSCADDGKAVVRAVTPGQYSLFLAGYGRATGMNYEQSMGQSAYPVSVQPGVFFNASSPATDFLSVDLIQLP